MGDNKNLQIYDIQIDLEDTGKYTDVLAFLYKTGVFPSLKRLKEKYNPDGIWPIDGDVKEAYLVFDSKMMEQGTKQTVFDEINNIRKRCSVLSHFEKTMYMILATGVVTESSYKRAYYEFIKEFTTDEDSDFGKHVIVLHPATTEQDILFALRKFQDAYDIQSKSRMKSGKPKKHTHKQAELNYSQHYNKLLVSIDSIPLANKTALVTDYPLYQRYMKANKKIIGLVLDEMKTRYTNHDDYGYDYYRKMQTATGVKGTSDRKVREEAELFMKHFSIVRTEIDTKLKSTKKLLSQISSTSI